jgi:hypothetical protein
LPAWHVPEVYFGGYGSFGDAKVHFKKTGAWGSEYSFRGKVGPGMRWALNWDDYKEEVGVLESAGVEDIGEALERVVGLDVLRVMEGGDA